MCIKKVIFVCLLILASVFCNAENTNSDFWSGIARVASFGKPFWADMHSTLMRAEIAYATNSPDYDYGNFNSSYRLYVFSNLGLDIPIWSGDFSGGKYGFSLSLPFSIDVWYDRFEWITSPVINTSYRFSASDIGFINRMDSPIPVFPKKPTSSTPKFFQFNIYNWAIKFSPFKHESTHIGDELTIHRKNLDLPITRVDVAANFAELVFILNDPDNQPRLNHGFKLGLMFNYSHFKTGWYSILNSEANSSTVKPSQFPFEIFAQYQYQSPLFSKGFQVIASVEYRLREKYKYLYSYSGELEHSFKNNPQNIVNCFNFFTGIRYDNQKRSYFSKIGIGARYYIGINPYGQFRSMPYYSQFGLVAIFE